MASNNSALRIIPDVLRTLAFGAISGTYVGIGTPFPYPVRIIHILNTTDVLLTFSVDGVNPNFVVPSNSFLLLDLTANATSIAGASYIAAGTRIYVEGTPTLGAVYVATFYGTNG
jgi:hypothetical protein